MNPLALLIDREILDSGPMKFGRYMELCLTHPEFGYYRRDPFGKAGDFYTAEQLQPVFGRLMRSYLRKLAPNAATVVELGAGRREMADAFSCFDYVPVDLAYGKLPAPFEGIVFSNEFFDALPVDLVVRNEAGLFERRVGAGLRWDDSIAWSGTMPEDLELVELQTSRTEWLRRIAESMTSGVIVTIDYGYTRRELIRFPQGTLMSYRRHTASDNVLRDPGERDITAHVDFTALQEAGEAFGLRTVRFETLASALLFAGEDDSFASALDGDDRYRLQLKTLLFGMGETFRVLVQEKAA